MSSLSFVLVKPQKRATAAAKHKERVAIHSHAQKVTQQRKREKRLQASRRSSKTLEISTTSTPNLTKVVLEHLVESHDVTSWTGLVNSRTKPALGLLTPSPEPSFDRPFTNYSAWTDDHKYGVSMFQHVTILDINSINTNLVFWKEVVPAYAEVWECVRHILSAIACANEAIQNRNDELYLTALQLHIKAVIGLRRDLSRLSVSAQVASCLLFEAFSVLQCNFALAGKQIEIAHMLTKKISIGAYLEDEKLPIVCDALAKMAQVPTWSLWDPTHFLKGEGLRYAEPHIMLELDSIGNYNGNLMSLIESMQKLTRHFTGRLRRNLSQLAYIDPTCRMATDVLIEFKGWKMTFDAYARSCPPPEEYAAMQQAELMWSFTYIMFTSGVIATGELVYDDPKYIENYHRICELAEQRFNETCDYSKHSTIKAFLQILVPSLWLVILVCRHSDIRFRAIRILKSRHYLESDFDSFVTGKIAEAVVQIEAKGYTALEADEIVLDQRIHVEGIKYDEPLEAVILSYSFATPSGPSSEVKEMHLPWRAENKVKFNAAINALSQVCTLYRKVRPQFAPSGCLKPIYYQGQVVPVLLTQSYR